MEGKAKWIGEEDPLDRTEVGRKGEATKIINQAVVNSKVDMVHQMGTFGNLPEEYFSGSWIHDIPNSHGSSSGEALNWRPNFWEQIAPE